MAVKTVLEALARQEIELTTRGSGSPPTFESFANNDLAPCSFCRLPLLDLGCRHLFCPRCQVFARAPPSLQWETAGGNKASLCASDGNREARTLWPEAHGPSGPVGFFNPLTAAQPNALPPAGCLTSTCSGNPLSQAEPWLTGPRFFPTMWAESQASPETPHIVLGGHPDGPPHLPPWPGPVLPPVTAGPEGFTVSGLPNSLASGSKRGGTTPPPGTSFQADQNETSRPRGCPVSLHKALLARQQSNPLAALGLHP